MSAIGTLDRAANLVRHAGPGPTTRAFVGGIGMAFGMLLPTHAIHVEGVRGANAALGIFLALGFVFRAVQHAHAARAMIRHAAPTLELDGEVSALDTARTAAWVACELFVFFLWLPMMHAGASATWIARAGTGAPGGFRGYRAALADLARRRSEGLGVGTLMLVAVLGLYFNLWLVFFFVVAIGHGLLGFDTSTADAFLSLENTFAIVMLLGLTMALLDPLRVAISVVLFLDARSARDAFDLQHDLSGIETKRARAGLVSALAIAACLSPAAAWAQPPPDPLAPPPEPFQAEPEFTGEPEVPDYPEYAWTERDEDAADTADAILRQDEFREFGELPGYENAERSVVEWLQDLLRRIIEAILDALEEAAPSGDMGNGGASMPTGLGGGFARVLIWMAGITVALIALFFIVDAVRRRRRGEDEDDADELDPREASSDAFVDDADLKARTEAYRDALRALYLACLSELDANGLIDYDPTKTNWQYQRKMPRGPVREHFRGLTEIFDRVWYGETEPSREDYAHARGLTVALRAALADAPEAR